MRNQHHHNLINYVDELINLKGRHADETIYLQLADLDDDEKKELAALAIEDADRDCISECVCGDDFSINSEYNCALIKMLNHDSKENRDDFARITANNTVKYFEKSLNELISERVVEVIHEDMNERGYYGHVSRKSGELEWRHV